MASLLSIFDDGRWLFSNRNALILFMAFVENATGGWEVLAISKRFRGGAVVSMMGGGVYDGNGSIEGRPCVSRLVMMI